MKDISQILASKATENGYRSWFSDPKNSYSLKSEKMVKAFDDAIAEANHVDCIWFEGEKNMPAIFKVCKDDDFILAVYRLKNFKELMPPYYTKFFLIASDNLEQQILSELGKPVFKNFDVTIIPLSKLQSFNLN